MIKTIAIHLLLLLNIVSANSEQIEIHLVDKVPSKQTKKKTMSLMITSCKYASYQIGDKQLLETRMRMLQKHLSNELDSNMNGKTFVVKNFTIHVNATKNIKGAVQDTQVGIGAEIIKSMDKIKVGCSGDDFFGGYTLDEVPEGNTWNPLIVVIDVEVDGELYHSRTVNIPTVNFKASTKYPEFTKLVDLSIQKNSILLNEIIN